MSLFRRLRTRLSVLVLATLLALLAIAAPVALAQTGPHYNEAHPILAYYYGWWEPEVLAPGWGAYDAAQLPGGGARQVSEDAGLLRTHVKQAQAAGIDGFITNRIVDMDRLAAISAGTDFRLTFQVDSNGDIPTQLAQF